MQTIQSTIEGYDDETGSIGPSEDEEMDTTKNWIPLVVLIVAVPFMLGLFILIGYWVI